MDFYPDSKELLELFLANDVTFLVVGGYALAAHGLPRGTDDLDLWVWSTPENAERILDVLNKFGFAELKLTVEDLSTPDKVIQLGYPPARIDLLTSISGVEFDEAWRLRKSVHFNGLDLPVISKVHMIINKWIAGRPQDLVDLEKLLRQAQRK